MFLDVVYYPNKNIIIPEVFLESNPTFEENLCKTIKETDIIANSGDAQRIFEYLIQVRSLRNELELYGKYDGVMNILFSLKHKVNERCNKIEIFMSHIKYPNIINCDVVKDLMPVAPIIMFGNYNWVSTFECIFRYILYVKTKHLHLLKDVTKINFKPMCEDDNFDEMENNFLFNY